MNTTLYVCTANLAQLKKQDELEYRMVVVQFGHHLLVNGEETNLEKTGPEALYQNLINAQILQREPNFALFKYRKIMSFIFLVASAFNLALFSVKVFPLEPEKIGFLKKLHYFTLSILCLYNMLYSLTS